MFVKGNQVISRMFALNGLLFNAEGLSYVLNKNGFQGGYPIPITTDDKKICECLGLDYEKVVAADYDAFFRMITESRFFFKEMFMTDASDGECKMLGLMVTYLKTAIENDEYVSKKRERMNIEYILMFFKDEKFTSDYTKVCHILAKHHLVKENFNGQVILRHRPDYDKRKLSTTIPYFTKEYPRIEREYLMVTKTQEEIVAEFESFTNHLL